jgi:hypothetical protein
MWWQTEVVSPLIQLHPSYQQWIVVPSAAETGTSESVATDNRGSESADTAKSESVAMDDSVRWHPSQWQGVINLKVLSLPILNATSEIVAMRKAELGWFVRSLALHVRRFGLEVFIPSSAVLPCKIDWSGSGRRSVVEATRIGNIYSPIAWLPPGYEPGTGDGVASAARQRGLFCLGTFWFDDATSGSRRRIAIAA